VGVGLEVGVGVRVIVGVGVATKGKLEGNAQATAARSDVIT